MLLLSLAFILFPLAFLDKAFSALSKKIIIFFFCIIFILLGGFRWNTGTDWIPYHDAFQAASTYYDAVQTPYSFEWGFGMMNYIIKGLFDSYTIFLLIFSFITIYVKYKVISNKLFLSYGLFSFYLFFCYSIGDIVATRQSLAVSITFFSLLFIIKRQFWVFLLCIVVATLIHRSSIIFLFSYFVYHLNLSRKSLFIVFISSILIGFGMGQAKFVLFEIPFLSNFSFLTSYQNKIDLYNELGEVAYGSVSSNLINILGMLKKLIFILPLIYLRKNNNSIGARLLNIVVFGSVIYFVLGAIASDFKRLNTFFEIIEILVVPFFIFSITNKRIRYILILFYCTLAFTRLYSAVFTFWDLYDPFFTIFDFNNSRTMY